MAIAAAANRGAYGSDYAAMTSLDAARVAREREREMFLSTLFVGVSLAFGKRLRPEKPSLTGLAEFRRTRRARLSYESSLERYEAWSEVARAEWLKWCLRVAEVVSGFGRSRVF